MCDEGSTTLHVVTDEGLPRWRIFQVVLVRNALVSASEVCHKVYRMILDAEPGQWRMGSACAKK